ncbi:unnamed protein product [Penicillium glandicola]
MSFFSKGCKAHRNRNSSNVPKNYSQWRERAQELRLQTTTPHNLSSLHPASKMTEEEFLSMRALWPKRNRVKEFPRFDAATAEKVTLLMNDCSELEAYLQQVRNPHNAGFDRALGAFLLVRLSQQSVQSEPIAAYIQPSRSKTRPKRVTRRPSFLGMAMKVDCEMLDSQSSEESLSEVSSAADFPITPGRTEDEQIVNDALLQFLTALVIYYPDSKCQWTSARSPFGKTKFGQNSMKARTDGYLTANGEVFAIVEVKPQIRDRKRRPEVLWQETGEMVAWIMRDGKHGRKCPVRRRLLISQDNHEIFLTIASYKKRYVNYLNNGNISKSTKSSFLTMKEYGPWIITRSSDMRDLARIILSLAVEVTDDLARHEHTQQN